MMNRSRTIATFFAATMAVTVLGAVVTTQIRRPAEAQARSTAAEPASAVGLDTFRDIARKASPGVVNINTRHFAKKEGNGSAPSLRNLFGDDFTERFFGPQEDRRSLGSGFVVDKDGYVLTNRHVVDDADEINVTFSDDTSVEAKVVGKDARTDVALLKITPPKALDVVELGDSDQVEVGEWVMAIGNPFGLGGNSVTVGVVSFKGRDLSLGVRGTSVNMIQTDAAINPGNSGGPLLNSRGQVIGINTLIVTGGERQSAGVGFSVPINVAKEILPQLRQSGRVVRGWMGVGIQPVSRDLARSYGLSEPKGTVVGQVTAGSPAETAGLQVEDLIVAVDGRSIKDNSDLSSYIASKAPNSSVKLRFLRGSPPVEKEVTVTLGTFPDEGTKVAASTGHTEKLGMTVEGLSPSVAERLGLPRGSEGAVVREVEPGSAADRAGLGPGDVIVGAGGAPVRSVAELEKSIESVRKDGGILRLRVRSAAGDRFVAVRLGN